MEFISMTCRNCGGKLQISKDADQVICQNCGSEYLITFKEGTISIKSLVEGVMKIQESTDKTASELALERIRQDKLNIEKELIDYLIEVRWMDRKDKLYPISYIVDYYQRSIENEGKGFFPNHNKIYKMNNIIDRLSQFKVLLEKKDEEEKRHFKMINS